MKGKFLLLFSFLLTYTVFSQGVVPKTFSRYVYAYEDSVGEYCFYDIYSKLERHKCIHDSTRVVEGVFSVDKSNIYFVVEDVSGEKKLGKRDFYLCKLQDDNQSSILCSLRVDGGVNGIDLCRGFGGSILLSIYGKGLENGYKKIISISNPGMHIDVDYPYSVFGWDCERNVFIVGVNHVTGEKGVFLYDYINMVYKNMYSGDCRIFSTSPNMNFVMFEADNSVFLLDISINRYNLVFKKRRFQVIHKYYWLNNDEFVFLYQNNIHLKSLSKLRQKTYSIREKSFSKTNYVFHVFASWVY